MTHKRRKENHARSYYRNDLLVWRLAQIPTTPKQTASIADVSHHTVADALSGDCKKMETLWVIANALNLKWEYLFRLDLPESQFHRAVIRSGSSEAVR